MPEIKQDLRTATFIVAANNSLHKNMADYACSGVADDVQINLALNALPASGGRVVLLEGTFILANPIVIPANNITLRGQGRSTLIDGDPLTTGNHAIVISGVTNCCIKKLAIQTESGGGKACDCIHIEDGANDFEIEYVTIVASDSDGIRIEGTTILEGYIHDCNINQADQEGIQVNMDGGAWMYRLHVTDCFITGTGINGFYAANRMAYSTLDGNVCFGCGLHGISLLGCSYNNINNNIAFGNTQFGINITTSNHINANNNVSYNNVQHGIFLGNSDECVVEGNICTLNDSGDTATYDGIHTNNTSHDNLITGNHCCNNHNYGIAIYGDRNSVEGNYCHENDRHGIYISAAECMINDNYCYDNGQDAVGTYHGINLTEDADRCQVNDNFCSSPGDSQEDGIHLEDGTTHVQIVGNYCYNGMGSGICLAANNADCQIEGNFCSTNDDYGIEVEDGCDRCMINNNKCYANANHGIYVNANDYCSIVGNICNGNTGDTTDGIYLDTCDYCTISSNICTLNGDDGIVLVATSTKCIVIGNQLLANTGAALTDGGTDTEKAHNIVA